jgi:type IV pilus assembly protein PilE
MATRRHARGFGLVETVAALAVVGVVASVALPTFRDASLRGHRIDATQSLQRLQAAQEQYRLDQGGYAERLDQLPGLNGQSQLGRYRVELRDAATDGYTLVAIASGEQAGDTPCRNIRLRVAGSFTHHEPGTPCWQR